jgi:uncharacterized protein
MKNKIIIYLLILIFLTNFVSATPKIEPYVNDFGKLLTQEQITTLNLLADEIEHNTSWEIAIVSVLNTEGLDRLTYANNIGDENGVGKQEKDNGVVVLWSEGDERGLAIATGRYSESVLNDAKVGRIARAARPYFDDKKYYEGFTNITLELKNELIISPTASNLSNFLTPNVLTNDKILICIIIVLLLFWYFIFPLFNSTNTDQISIGSSSGSSSGSGGGFSSGGFSGGSFGGGGAKA